jgi:hypothetical protein
VPNTPKPSPPWLVNGIGRVRAGPGQLRRCAIPANIIASLQIAQGAWLTQAIYTASKLGLFDALGKGPASSDELANRAGGREQTAAEHTKPMPQAGFRVTDVLPTAAPMSIVEARPA